MKRIFGLAFCLALAGVQAGAEAPKEMKLFLLIGQSNMAGRGNVTPADRETNPRIFMLTKENQWVPAKDPVHFDKPKVAGVGLGSEFARQVAAADPKAVIGLIPCAVGGTSLGRWMPGSALYTNAVARARHAMKDGKLAGILWHQGESDCEAKKIASYPKRFAKMIGALRKDLGAEKVPVVIGEIGWFRQGQAAFNDMLPQVAAAVPDCALVSSKELKDRGDNLHFDTPSLYRLGKRYFEAWAKRSARKF